MPVQNYSDEYLITLLRNSIQSKYESKTPLERINSDMDQLNDYLKHKLSLYTDDTIEETATQSNNQSINQDVTATQEDNQEEIIEQPVTQVNEQVCIWGDINKEEVEKKQQQINERWQQEYAKQLINDILTWDDDVTQDNEIILDFVITQSPVTQVNDNQPIVNQIIDDIVTQVLDVTSDQTIINQDIVTYSPDESLDITQSFDQENFATQPLINQDTITQSLNESVSKQKNKKLLLWEELKQLVGGKLNLNWNQLKTEDLLPILEKVKQDEDYRLSLLQTKKTRKQPVNNTNQPVNNTITNQSVNITTNNQQETCDFVKKECAECFKQFRVRKGKGFDVEVCSKCYASFQQQQDNYTEEDQQIIEEYCIKCEKPFKLKACELQYKSKCKSCFINKKKQLEQQQLNDVNYEDFETDDEESQYLQAKNSQFHVLQTIVGGSVNLTRPYQQMTIDDINYMITRCDQDQDYKASLLKEKYLYLHNNDQSSVNEEQTLTQAEIMDQQRYEELEQFRGVLRQQYQQINCEREEQDKQSTIVTCQYYSSFSQEFQDNQLPQLQKHTDILKGLSKLRNSKKKTQQIQEQFNLFSSDLQQLEITLDKVQIIDNMTSKINQQTDNQILQKYYGQESFQVLSHQEHQIDRICSKLYTILNDELNRRFYDYRLQIYPTNCIDFHKLYFDIVEVISQIFYKSISKQNN